MTTIQALKVNQWLQPEWDQTRFHPVPPRGKPEPSFYVFSISAYDLKRLSGIYRRDPGVHPSEDMGIQRRHEPSRSEEILRYLVHGFPLSRIDPKKLVDKSEEQSLQMPGWLPTAIIANILTDQDQRGPSQSTVASNHLIRILDTDTGAVIHLPNDYLLEGWAPHVHPIEIIDGQHRLWALDEPTEPKKRWTAEFREKLRQLQVPVVAFHGLDRTWQAYLFYTINQLPKKIDQSLVFDLYPLLRDEDWLLRFEGPNIYRETRAQDLTTILWSHPESPWKGRVIRLGGREKGKITQASFIRSLTASFIKRWIEDPRRIGGLFGAPARTHFTTLEWTREQQAALLIVIWSELLSAVKSSPAPWSTDLVRRCQEAQTGDTDCSEAPFSGPETLLSTDQGVRGYLLVMNDLILLGHRAGEFNLGDWHWIRESKHANDHAAVSSAIKTLRDELPLLLGFIRQVAMALASFDWRVSSAIPATDPLYLQQAAYRGSSGYRELRRRLLLHIREKEARLAPFVDQVMAAFNLEPEEAEELYGG